MGHQRAGPFLLYPSGRIGALSSPPGRRVLRPNPHHEEEATKRTAASHRKLLVEPLTGSIGSARGRNTDDGSTHPMMRKPSAKHTAKIDHTIEGGKPSPQ